VRGKVNPPSRCTSSSSSYSSRSIFATPLQGLSVVLGGSREEQPWEEEEQKENEKRKEKVLGLGRRGRSGLYGLCLSPL